MAQSSRKYEGHPQSAPGDFYVVNGECLSCGVPHVLAPKLFGWEQVEEGEAWHCIWKKQPETPDEIAQAINVIHASEAGCHRYAGNDVSIGVRVGSEYCDERHLADGPKWAGDWSITSGPHPPAYDLEGHLPVIGLLAASIGVGWLLMGNSLVGTGVLALSLIVTLVFAVRKTRSGKQSMGLHLSNRFDAGDSPREDPPAKT